MIINFLILIKYLIILFCQAYLGQSKHPNPVDFHSKLIIFWKNWLNYIWVNNFLPKSCFASKYSSNNYLKRNKEFWVKRNNLKKFNSFPKFEVSIRWKRIETYKRIEVWLIYSYILFDIFLYILERDVNLWIAVNRCMEWIDV